MIRAVAIVVVVVVVTAVVGVADPSWCICGQGLPYCLNHFEADFRAMVFTLVGLYDGTIQSRMFRVGLCKDVYRTI